MRLDELHKFLLNLLRDSMDRPVVVFSALWPFYRVIDDIPKQNIVDSILGVLLDVVGQHRDLLMPTFSKGFNNGFINLDVSPSLSGLMTEKFRMLNGTRRSICPWFSFSCLGPSTEEIIALRPLHAWGEGSLYEWMEKKDVKLLMLGTDACSYFHRVEWLNKEIITYRFDKKFRGRVLHEGKKLTVSQILFVRYLNPEVIHDFSVMNEDLIAGGMKKVRFYGVPISVINARQMHEVFDYHLQIDPYISISNREEIKKMADWYSG